MRLDRQGGVKGFPALHGSTHTFEFGLGRFDSRQGGGGKKKFFGQDPFYQGLKRQNTPSPDVEKILIKFGFVGPSQGMLGARLTRRGKVFNGKYRGILSLSNLFIRGSIARESFSSFFVFFF